MILCAFLEKPIFSLKIDENRQFMTNDFCRFSRKILVFRKKTQVTKVVWNIETNNFCKKHFSKKSIFSEIRWEFAKISQFEGEGGGNLQFWQFFESDNVSCRIYCTKPQPSILSGRGRTIASLNQSVSQSIISLVGVYIVDMYMWTL